MPRKVKGKIQNSKRLKEPVVDLTTDNQYKRVKNAIHNSISEAILGFTPGGIGTQLSQLDTLFINNRYYFISNMRQPLSEIYVEHGLIKKFIDLPVDDALRGGVNIKSKQLSPEQLDELKISCKREDIYNSISGRAEKWNRLFGGAGIITITDQDPETELEIEDINPDSDLEFRAVDMWELFYDKQNVEGFNPAIEDPKFDYYNYYGRKVHKSRVMKLKGLEAPSFLRPRFRGWGYSIVEGVIQSVNQYFKAKNLIFEVLDEFKIDVFKFDNLVSTFLGANGASQVQNRVQAANAQKNYLNALVLDAKDDYIQKQLQFTGLAEMSKEIRIQIASDLGFPLSKIFGLSATGFSSGEDDLENYNSTVEDVRSKMEYDILKIQELKCRKLFGDVPTDLELEWQPLRVLSSEQQENVKTQKFNRVLAARQASEITVLEFRQACNREDLLPIELDLEISELELAPVTEEPNQEKSDGANKEDSAKSQLKPKTGTPIRIE